MIQRVNDAHREERSNVEFEDLSVLIHSNHNNFILHYNHDTIIIIIRNANITIIQIWPLVFRIKAD
jgi:hypothetical protein